MLGSNHVQDIWKKCVHLNRIKPVFSFRNTKPDTRADQAVESDDADHCTKGHLQDQPHKATYLPLWQWILILNVEGLRSHRRRHKAQILKEYKVQFGNLAAAFCETHLNPSVNEAEIMIEDYSVHRANRLNRYKRVAVVYLRKDAAADA